MTKEQFKATLQATLTETGRSIAGDIDEISLYALERTAHLATLTNDPGFDQAVQAERDSVALKAGINVSQTADATDQRIIGVIHGAIQIGALALI